MHSSKKTAVYILSSSSSCPALALFCRMLTFRRMYSLAAINDSLFDTEFDMQSTTAICRKQWQFLHFLLVKTISLNISLAGSQFRGLNIVNIYRTTIKLSACACLEKNILLCHARGKQTRVHRMFDALCSARSIFP